MSRNQAYQSKGSLPLQNTEGKASPFADHATGLCTTSAQTHADSVIQAKPAGYKLSHLGSKGGLN